MDGMWVTPENLDINKISVERHLSKDSIERYDILYAYKDNVPPRNLIITVPRTPDAYIRCKGVKKDFFIKGDIKLETQRYGAQFVLSLNNAYHTALYKALTDIKQKVEALINKDITFPATEYESSSTIYTQLIHSNAPNCRMYSKAYTANEELNILDCNECVTRPSFMLSLLKSTSLKMRVQLSQMLVYETVETFPLANLD